MRVVLCEYRFFNGLRIMSNIPAHTEITWCRASTIITHRRDQEAVREWASSMDVHADALYLST